MYDVKVTINKVVGHCAAGFKEGDYFYLKGPNLVPTNCKGICIYGISALIPYLTAYCRDTSPNDWINFRKELQCPDNKNTVTFGLSREIREPKKHKKPEKE